MQNNTIDYKRQKQEAKKNKRSNSTRSSQNEEEPYYKKKSKKKPPVMDSMDEDQETWAKGKLKSGNLFSDSDSEPVNNNTMASDSDEEKPVPVSIVKKEKKVEKAKPILPPDSSSDSEDNKKKKKKKISRKGVFSDSGESSSSNDDDDSEDEEQPKDQTQPTFMQNITKYITEPGCVSTAKGILKKVFNDRGSSNISVAFKGGKESSVLLHLMKVVLDEMQLSYDILDVVYFAPVEDEIRILNEYVQSFTRSLKMHKNLKVIETNDLTEGLQKYIHSTNVNTMVIGIKSSDEGAKSLQSTMQTQDIVQLNRVHPLLKWTYKDVWDYIEANDVTICSLYNDGYTKLQTSSTTTRNPLLSDKKMNKFSSASKLTDPSRESWSVFETMEGKVLKGGQRGKLLMGVPTARVDANPYGLADGIYVGKARVNEMDKKYRKAIVSISSRIDLSGKHKRTVSVYISHRYSTDFYGKYMSIHILGLLRKQQQYDTELQLRNAMDVDIKYLESIVIDREMKV